MRSIVDLSHARAVFPDSDSIHTYVYTLSEWCEVLGIAIVHVVHVQTNQF